jgi:hypothetical protein
MFELKEILKLAMLINTIVARIRTKTIVSPERLLTKTE